MRLVLCGLVVAELLLSGTLALARDRTAPDPRRGPAPLAAPPAPGETETSDADAAPASGLVPIVINVAEPSKSVSVKRAPFCRAGTVVGGFCVLN